MDQLEIQVLTVTLVTREHQERLAHQVHQDNKVSLDCKDHPAHRARQDFRAMQERLEALVVQVRPVLQDQMELQARLD